MDFIVNKLQDTKLIEMLYPFLINDNVCVAGGFFKDYFNNKKCNDIDIYCLDSDTAKDVKIIFDRLYKKDFSTNNVTRYHNGKTQVDLITKIYGDAKEIISQFDFTICEFAVYRKSGDFYAIYRDRYFMDLHSKIISTKNSPLNFPLSTFKRLAKYIKYGFYPNEDTLLDIAMAINETDEAELCDEFYNSEDL